MASASRLQLMEAEQENRELRAQVKRLTEMRARAIELLERWEDDHDLIRLDDLRSVLEGL